MPGQETAPAPNGPREFFPLFWEGAKFRPGLSFGQCSEICGINHRFIPIILERTDYYNFVN